MLKRLLFRQSTPGEGRFIRQMSGGGNRYGHVRLLVEPLDNEPFQWAWEVSESEIPAMFESAVREGVFRSFEEGARLDGYCLDGLHVRILGGSFHNTDSNEIAYTMAAAVAFGDAVTKAGAMNVV